MPERGLMSPRRLSVAGTLSRRQTWAMELDQDYPAIPDLARRAKRRLPRFVWEYLDSGTGTEATTRRNRTKLDRILLRPSVLHGEMKPDLSTRMMGQNHHLPFGIAPVGMSGLIWSGAERMLAAAAAGAGIPYCLSTVAATMPEEIGPVAEGRGWFQLYPPRDPEMLADMLSRAKGAGFQAIVLTVDSPTASRRERQRRCGIRHPQALTPRILLQAVTRPAWALATAFGGIPRPRFLEAYADIRGPLPATSHIGYLLRTSPDWDYLKRLREAWDGQLAVKGILQPGIAARLAEEGVDAVWVSNHGGRQFDAAPASIEALKEVRSAVGPDYPLIMDGGIASGLDVLRALAMGADFVMLAKAFHYGVAAFGARGAVHVAGILERDIVANMGQLGIRTPREARNRAIAESPRAP